MAIPQTFEDPFRRIITSVGPDPLFIKLFPEAITQKSLRYWGQSLGSSKIKNPQDLTDFQFFRQMWHMVKAMLP